MKTLIILTATEEKLEYIPLVRSNIVLYVGEMNLEDDDTAPANAMCFNGQLSKEAKEHIVNQIRDEYNDEIEAAFFEMEGNEAISPDDYTFTIKSK